MDTPYFLSLKNPGKSLRKESLAKITIEFLLFVRKRSSSYTPYPFNAATLTTEPSPRVPDRVFYNCLLTVPPAKTKMVKSAPKERISAVPFDLNQQIPVTWWTIFRLFHQPINKFANGCVINIGSGVGVCFILILCYVLICF